VNLKYLIIFAVLVLLGALIYSRLRPYIATARRVLGVVRDLRRMSTPTASQPRYGGSGNSPVASEKLIRCQTCGTWIPSTRAVSLGGRGTASSYYCSHACLERSAESRPPKVAGGKHR
jgi:hypothetical protein